MNAELSLVSDWLKANKLSLNVSNIALHINGTPINNKKSCKYFGVILDENLSWSEQIQAIHIKTSKGLGIIAKLRHLDPRNLMRVIYFSFFQCHVTYSIESWASAQPTILEPIKVSMRKAVRLINFSDNEAPSSPLFSKLKILNFNLIKTLNEAKLIWKRKNNKLPLCINNIFIKPHNTSKRLIIPSSRTVVLGRTHFKSNFLSARFNILWDRLPVKIREKLHKL